MPPKSSPLVEVRVTIERAWAYEAWMSRLSWGQMRRLANEPPERGGLGYDLSESALKGLVEQARNDRGDMTLTRDQRLERQSAELDERARAARHDFGAAYQRMRKLDERIATFDVYDYDTISDANAALRNLVVERAGVAADLERADRRLDSVHEREAKLHGLNAPTEAKLEVTQRDAIDAAVAELADDLERLASGKKA